MRKLAWLLPLATMILAGCSGQEASGDAQVDKYSENKAAADKLAEERGETPVPAGQAGEN